MDDYRAHPNENVERARDAVRRWYVDSERWNLAYFGALEAEVERLSTINQVAVGLLREALPYIEASARTPHDHNHVDRELADRIRSHIEGR